MGLSLQKTVSIRWRGKTYAQKERIK